MGYDYTRSPREGIWLHFSFRKVATKDPGIQATKVNMNFVLDKYCFFVKSIPEIKMCFEIVLHELCKISWLPHYSNTILIFYESFLLWNFFTVPSIPILTSYFENG